MHFLRTLFWVIIAVGLLIFARQNNQAVTVQLWGGLQADVKLWLLVVAPFLLGFLPTWVFHRISVWQARRRAEAAAQRAADMPLYRPLPSTSAPDRAVSAPEPGHPKIVVNP